MPGGSAPGTISISLGGSARNDNITSAGEPSHPSPYVILPWAGCAPLKYSAMLTDGAGTPGNAFASASPRSGSPAGLRAIGACWAVTSSTLVGRIVRSPQLRG